MAKQPRSEKPKAKDAELKVRIDPDLKQQLEAKAESRGWTLGAVARALFRLWLVEDVLTPDDVGEEQRRSPKKPRKPRKTTPPDTEKKDQ